MNQEPMRLEARQLRVGYPKKTVAADVEFTVHSGEILALVGPNGAGKSTLMKSIAGQLALQGGTVLLSGKNMTQLSPKETAKELSLLLTGQAIPELMTCREVVAAGRYPYTGKMGILGSEDWAKVDAAMARLHAEELAERPFDAISDGQRQRILLARALCQEPDVLVLDEPTSFLDIRYKLEFLSVVQQLSRRQHLTVVMSLHEVDLAQRISHKLACIKGDRVERFGTAEEIFVPGYIESLYGVTLGDFDFRGGSLELEKPQGQPRAFVLGGNGTGTPVFRQLQRQGIPFVAGVLWANDLDCPVARALAVETVELPAFAPVSPEALELARHWIDETEYTLCALSPQEMTGGAAPLGELVQYAEQQGKLRHGL